MSYVTPGSRNEPLCHTYVTRSSERVNENLLNRFVSLYYIGIDYSTIVCRLNIIGKIQKYGKWVPY